MIGVLTHHWAKEDRIEAAGPSWMATASLRARPPASEAAGPFTPTPTPARSPPWSCGTATTSTTSGGPAQSGQRLWQAPMSCGLLLPSPNGSKWQIRQAPTLTTPDQVQVRKATPADIDVLVGFSASMAMETEGRSLDTGTVEQGTKAVFDSPEKGYFLVAEADGEVVGSLLCMEEWSDWRSATFWWVQSVYVRPDWRRKGIYRLLHNRLYEAARATEGVCGVRLYVDKDNHIAQTTYTSLGNVQDQLRPV